METHKDSLNDEGGALHIDDILSENKNVQEYWQDGHKFRVSVYNKSFAANIEVHFVFNGKILTTVSNISPKEEVEFTEEQAKVFAMSKVSDDKAAMFKDALGAIVKFRFLGKEKLGNYNCYVIQSYLPNDNAEDEEDRELLKTAYYVDKKTNIIVKTVMPGFEDIANEVKEIKKIHGKYIPVVIETASGDISKTITSYEVRVNEPIDAEIFDASAIPVEFNEEYYKETGGFKGLTQDFADMMKAFAPFEKDEEDIDFYDEKITEEELQKRLAETDRQLAESQKELDKVLEENKKQMEQLDKDLKEMQEKIDKSRGGK